MIVAGTIAACWPATPPPGLSNLVPQDQIVPQDQSTEIDFGPVFSDEVPEIKHSFPVKNTTSATIHVLRMDHSCACSKVDLGKRELDPGEETVLAMQVDLRDKTGPQRLTCDLYFDSGIVMRYAMKAVAHHRIAFVPSVLHFGQVDPGQATTSEASLIVQSRSGSDLPQVLSAISNCDQLKVSRVDPQGTEENGVTAMRNRFQLSLTPTCDTGSHNCMVITRYHWRGKEREANLWITWTVRRHIEATPMRVFFAKRAESDSAHVRVVRLKSIGDRSFEILRISATDSQIAGTTCLRRLATVHEVRIEVTPSDRSQPVVGDLIIDTDHPMQPKLTIPVTALAR